MTHISRDNPCFYLTSVAKDRLSVFRSEAVKGVTCILTITLFDSGWLSELKITVGQV
ncbi:MAG: hypothetical protein LC770_08745 [Acidobacteria bacterium]|nr:hypothetical protein [Acidobacteriota bacterium]